MPDHVVITMATFNGAPWLEAQVRSLQAQDEPGWRLMVRDDGSSDGTPALLARLAREEPRLEVMRTAERLGVVGNFGALLTEALKGGADYVFPCDQDDVWRPDKVSRTLAAMRRLEASSGRGAPLLVHSDLEVVDRELRQVQPSFLRYQGIGHEEVAPLQVLLVQNFVTGCTSLLNRALLELALPLPERCIMHDWWVAQCAAAAGVIGFVPEATVRYRQHGANQIGAGGAWANLNLLRAQSRRGFMRSWQVARQTVDQAALLHQRLLERGVTDPRSLALAEGYGSASALPACRRLYRLRKLGIRRQRPLGTALLYLRLALLGVGAGDGEAG